MGGDCGRPFRLGSVPRLTDAGILKRGERKAARLAVCVPNDGACVHVAKLGMIAPQAL